MGDEVANIVCEEQPIDVEVILETALPELHPKELVSTSIAGEEVLIVTPAKHACMKKSVQCFQILQGRLVSRVSSLFTSCEQTTCSGGCGFPVKQWLMLSTSERACWTSEERQQLADIASYVTTFLSMYSNAIVSDPNVVKTLKNAISVLDGQHKELYQACVRDMLGLESGFGRALTAGVLLRQAAAESTTSIASSPSMMFQLERFMEAAAHLQPRAKQYTQGLAEASGGMAPTYQMKGIFRVLEKRFWDYTGAILGQHAIMDAARTMVVYDNMENFARGAERIQVDRADKVVSVVRFKDRFTKPMGGWSDFLVNLIPTIDNSQPSAVPFEIQLCHKKMLILRHDVGGHDSYEQLRFASDVLARQNQSGHIQKGVEVVKL